MSLSTIEKKISKTIKLDGRNVEAKMYYEYGYADDYRGYVNDVYVFVKIHKYNILGYEASAYGCNHNDVYNRVKKDIYDKMDNITTEWLKRKGFTDPNSWGC